MAVFRVEKNKDYTVMSNHHLRNTDLSLRAKGLLSQILSLPEGWDYTITGLAKINKEGKDAIRVAIQELEQAGYIERRRTRGEGGTYGGNEYVVYEEPRVTSPSSDFPTLVKPTTEKPTTENPTQLNKDISSKDINTPQSPPEGDAAPKKKKGGNRECKSAADVLPERFEGFWLFYRTHMPEGSSAGNRQKAIRAWDKLAPDDALATAMARSLNRQVQSAAWGTGVGVPHASTWLNNRGWEDDWGPAQMPAGPDPGGEGRRNEEWL